jgi:eukaryotic-like serine/threonine-protein kinase
MEPTRTERQSDGPPAPPTTLKTELVEGEELVELLPGMRVQDFELIREIGKGGFASVFLARQVSLDRLVALKASFNHGLGEAQTLATLEHDHIVKVYTEFLDPSTGRHFLCLQYVPGTNLYAMIHHLFPARPPRSGHDLILAVDQLSTDTVGFDPSAVQNREILSQGSYAEAVCWIGAQLARALAFAHARNILHCDIKPANILVNRYGKPMLADFNVSIHSDSATGLGGTLDFMAPETLDAIGRSLSGKNSKVDGRADIYSLGIVLCELATGRRPFPTVLRPEKREGLVDVAKARGRMTEAARESLKNVSPALARVVERCLKHDPEERYRNGIELAEALHNAREMSRVERKMPRPGPLTRFARGHVLAALLFVTLLPNLVGSGISIWYNQVEVELTDAQKARFPSITTAYNLIAYPLCVFLMASLIVRFLSGWRKLHSADGMTNEEIDDLRRFVLRFPDFTILYTALGWFPGGVIFPLLLDWYAGPIPWQVYAHFAISFTISGLAGIVYSYFGVQWIVLHVLYPRLDIPDRDRGLPIVLEMRKIRRWLGLCEILAGLTPLLGAILLILIAQNAGTMPFRLLVSGLILGGMFGIAFAVKVTDRLSYVLDIRSSERGPPARGVGADPSGVLHPPGPHPSDRSH